MRSNLTGNGIARVLFILHQGQMVLLHGFIKKTQKMPQGDLDIARERVALTNSALRDVVGRVAEGSP